MRLTLIAPVLVALLASPVLAQIQQAGELSDTEGAFQKLVEQCDNVDMLVLRGRIRLQQGRVPADTAAMSQTLMEEGFKLCGEGDAAGGKAKLEESLALVEAKASEIYDAQAEAASQPEPEPEPTAQGETEQKPWWQLW
ncbi:MAG: hypothetical protein AAGC81_09960 [Pseudomonadota bacterium]